VNKGGVKRRLSAILAADVAGYTRLMEQDSAATVTAWQSARADLIDPTIDTFSGRIVKHTGDGFLAEFPTVQDAVRCVITLQNKLVDNPLDFRMGVSLGDIIDDGEDIHGEGVNIAARIQGLAEPGGICVSSSVYEQVHNQIAVTFEDIGEQEVRHVSSPVRVFRVRVGDKAAAAARKHPRPEPSTDSKTRELQTALRLAGMITLYTAPGLAILGWAIGAFAELLGVAALVGFVGLGLIEAAKIIGRRAGPG